MVGDGGVYTSGAPAEGGEYEHADCYASPSTAEDGDSQSPAPAVRQFWGS